MGSVQCDTLWQERGRGLLLQHATFSHPTLVSPKFLHVTLEVGGLQRVKMLG